MLRYLLLNLGVHVSDIHDLDTKLEEIIKRYYNRDENFNPYMNSRNELIRTLIEGYFPTVVEWNKIACKKGYLSHTSIEYITGLNWKQLEKNLWEEIKRILR